MTMKLKLKTTDFAYYGVEEYIRPVTRTAAKYDLLIRVMCEILNTFDRFTEDVVHKVKCALELARYKIDEEDEDTFAAYKVFSENLEKFYWNVVDEEFAKAALRFDQKLYYEKGLRYPDVRLGRYRGLLLESLIDELVKERFCERKYATGCRIFVNGGLILARFGEGNAFHKETIDVAGWDDFVRYGEFYECKISPKRFENPNYRYFMEIKKAMDENKASQYILALVSADATQKLREQKKCLEEADPDCVIEFGLIGREDIFKISRYVIPTIA